MVALWWSTSTVPLGCVLVWATMVTEVLTELRMRALSLSLSYSYMNGALTDSHTLTLDRITWTLILLLPFSICSHGNIQPTPQHISLPYTH